MTRRQKIMAAHRAHPEWNGPQIARFVGCSLSYVRVVSSRYNLKLPRKHYERCPDGSVLRLGEACRDAGIRLADIAKFVEQRTFEDA